MGARAGSERWEAIFDGAPDAIVAIDAAGRVAAFNRAAERLFGRSRAETLGQAAALLADWPGAAATRADLALNRGDGSTLAAQATFSTVAGEGAPVLIAILRDAAPHADELRLLREARDAAEEAVRARGLLLAHVGHELRTPLSAIAGGTALLLDTRLDARQRELAETVRTSGCALTSVAGALVDITRLESGNLALDLAAMDVRHAVRDAIAIVGAAARPRRVRLSCHVGDAVPAAIEGDAGRLGQVLVNLLGNAIKFTRDGEVAVRVECVDIGDGVELHFAVRDTGIGIAAGDIPGLFRPFVQLDAGRERGGTGLGLAISKSLCELMGGRIWAESTPGRGSTFHFTLRAARAEAAAPAATGSLDVLVVDDDEGNRRIVAARLARLGHRVRTAVDGVRAVRACAAHSPHVVLMDVEMPGMDGLAAAQRIALARRTGARPRLVALTGHAAPGVRERLLAAGFDDYLCKPVDDAGLERAIAARAARAPMTPEDDPIDRTRFEELRRLDASSGLLADVVRHFVGEAPRIVGPLREEAARADRRALMQRAHRARSTALAVGAARVVRVCAGIEESAASGELWRVPPLIERLQAELGAACAALAQEIRAA